MSSEDISDQVVDNDLNKHLASNRYLGYTPKIKIHTICFAAFNFVTGDECSIPEVFQHNLMFQNAGQDNVECNKNPLACCFEQFCKNAIHT